MSDGNRETELDYKNRLNAKLQDSGEIDQLKQYLRQRLNESGWTAEMKSVCKGKSTLLIVILILTQTRFILYLFRRKLSWKFLSCQVYVCIYQNFP